MASNPTWRECWPTDEELQAAIDADGIVGTARKHGISHSTISRHVNGKRFQRPGHPIGDTGRTGGVAPGRVTPPASNRVASPALNQFTVEQTGDTVNVSLDNGTPDRSPAAGDDGTALLTAAGLDPAVFEVTSVRRKSWEAQVGGGDTAELTSAGITARRKFTPENAFAHIFGDGRGRAGNPAAKFSYPARRKRTGEKPRLAVIVSDPHVPAHDERLCNVLLPQFLRDIQPEELNLLGDINDFESVSRYKANTPEHANAVKECLDGSHDLMGNWSTAMPRDAKKQWIMGNHDQRLYDRISDRAYEYRHIQQAGTNQEVLDLEFLLNVERCGWTYPRSVHGEYGHEIIDVLGQDNIVGIHGDVARAKAGNTAHAYLGNDDLDVVFHGHDHRQAIVHRQTGKNAQKTKTGVSVGHLSKNDGHGYQPTFKVDSQQGFAVFSLWDDGTYHTELATYRGGALLFRGDRWT